MSLDAFEDEHETFGSALLARFREPDDDAVVDVDDANVPAL